MKPTQHVMLSTVVSAAFWAATKDVPATGVCFLSGILIDLDHHIDYLIVKKEFPWSYRKLCNYYATAIEKIYVFFHAYEWQLLLWLSICYYDLSLMWVALAIGTTTHLAADTFFNPIKPIGYSIIYRLTKGFNSADILTKKYLQSFK